MNPVIEALKFRHACKKFDPKRKIEKQDLDTIIEAAVLSPSSFGMEAWKFIVVASDSVKKRIRPHCWDQPQVTDSSHMIIILTKPSLIDATNVYVKQSFQRRNLPEDATLAYIDRYKWYHETEVEPLMSPYAWCAKQCYIALANIMTTAASLGIDSCPMEGFEKNKLESELGIDTDHEQIAVLVALGYRENEQGPRLRHSIDDLVEYM
jgi:nitroreductase